MIEKMSLAASRYMENNGVCIPDESEVVAFGLESLIADSLQVVILLGLSLLTGTIHHVFLFSFFYASLRRVTGGAHASSHWRCIAAFTLTAFICVSASRSFPAQYSRQMITALALFAVIVVFLRAPVGHANNPRGEKTIEAFKKRGRIRVLLQALSLVLAAFILPAKLSPYILCSGLGAGAAAFTLLIPAQGVDKIDEEGR